MKLILFFVVPFLVFCAEIPNQTGGFSLQLNCDCECKHANDTGTIDIHGLDICGESFERCCLSKPIKKEFRCGRRDGSISQNDSNEALLGEFPWMLALLRSEQNATAETNDTNFCGASLIHPQVALTAAHCVFNKYYSYTIRAGEWDIRTTNELIPHQDRKVQDIIIHPQYHRGTLFYDFALLILESPLDITDNVDVVCLPNKGTVTENLYCYATGWGRELFTSENPNTAILKKIGLPIIDRDRCQKQLRATRLGAYFKLHDTFICAGGEVGKDTCKGDGGGPLVCPIPGEEDKFYQAGIVAWGINCGKDVPGVYAGVVKVLDWIDEVMVSRKFDATIYQY